MEEMNSSQNNSYNSNNSGNITILPDPRSSAVLISLQSNKFFLFGGGSREKTFNDFWIMSVKKNHNQSELVWNEVTIKNISDDNFDIQPRFGSASCVIKDNYSDDIYNLYIHGGQNFFENKIYGDMLIIKLTKSEGTFNLQILENISTFPLDITKSPIQRNSHNMVNLKENIYIFGGGSSDGLLNDLWRFEILNKKWSKCEVTGKTISPREMFGMAQYTNKKNENYLYIFGGRLLESIDDKMYRINLCDYSCEYVTNLPIALCSFSYVLYKYFIIIYGGTDGNTFLNDIIIYNISNNKWAKSKIQVHSELVKNDPNLSLFLGRIASSMSVDYESEQLLIFGGSSIHKDTNYTCVLKLKDLLDENNLMKC